MNSFISPLSIMSVQAVAVDRTDPDLPDGVHVRIFAGSKASFPISPFVVINQTVREDEVYIPNTPPDEAAQRGDYIDFPVYHPDLKDRIIVFAEFLAPADRVKRVELLDQYDKVIAGREKQPWRFSAGNMNRFRVYGSYRDAQFLIGSTSEQEILHTDARDSEVLSLPVEKTHRWYVGRQNRDDGLKRVFNAAPLRLGPMDQPDGPLEKASPEREQKRVETLLKAPGVDSYLENCLWELVSSEQAPWLQIKEEKLPHTSRGAAEQYARVARLGHLQLAALDPGLAKFFGFSARLQTPPDPSTGCAVVFCLIAFDAAKLQADFAQSGIFDPGLPGPNDAFLRDIIARAIDPSGTGSAASDFNEIQTHADAAGLTVRPFVAVVAPVPPGIPPTLPQPAIRENQWESVDQDAVDVREPSSHHRATFAFVDPQQSTMLAVALHENGNWVSRHEPIARDPDLGVSRKFLSSLKQPLEIDPETGQPKGPWVNTALVSDNAIQASAGGEKPTPYRFWVSDIFGRFGDRVEMELPPPPRPKPPKPVLNYELNLTPSLPNDDGKRSPGTLIMAIRPSGEHKTEPKFGNGLIVPQLKELAAGALAITRVELAFNGSVSLVSMPTDWAANPVEPLRLSLPELDPQEQRETVLTAKFIDASDAESQQTEISIQLADPRPPRVIPTGQALYWTSMPSAFGEVELRLRWPAARNTTYRAFLADANSLNITGLAGNIDGLTRSQIGVAICAAQGIANNKELFRRLPDHSIKIDGNNAELFTTLSGSSETVHFLKIVPVNGNAVEASFSDCGLTPIAVPTSFRPAVPRLEGVLNSSSGKLKLSLIADKLDTAQLGRDEPGLFDPAKPGSVPPAFRIRMAASAKSDPIYARIIQNGALKFDQATGNFAPDVELAELQLSPFVKYSFWAEVQLPPERNIPPSVTPLFPTGGIEPIDASGKLPQKRPVSNMSVPLPIVWLRSAPPEPLRPEQITLVSKDLAAANPSVTISIDSVPALHPNAIGPYHLAAWYQWFGADEPAEYMPAIVLEGEGPTKLIAGQAMRISLARSNPTMNAIRLRLAVVDPAGKQGDLTSFEVP